MKDISKNEIINPETGKVNWEVDLTSQAMEYSDHELKTWIDQSLLNPELGEFAIERLQTIESELEKIRKFKEENPNPTQEQILEWYKDKKIPTKEEIEKGIALFKFLVENHARLKRAIEVSSNTQTFALPSHGLMFSLLALFAGKPERIPRELLEKSKNERTLEEQEKAEKYLESIFETCLEFDYSEGTEKKTEKKVALICNNQRVEGRAEISWSLFRNDIHFREERLAIYIKRTFGAEGLRHLLALIIGLEENFRSGNFEWSVNEHLERLGYRRKANGSFDPELKKIASEIVRIFTGLCITSIKKDSKDSGSITGKFLFMVEGFEIQTFQKEIIDQKITLVATDFWYKNALSSKDGHAHQYTKLLKEIVKENHQEHPLTLYLAPLLAIFWRMNPEKKIKVNNLMAWCDLETADKYKLRSIRDLEASLEYMKQKGYLGDWTHDGAHVSLTENKNPLNICLTLKPPQWLEKELIFIENKRETFAIEQKSFASKQLSLDEFVAILSNSGLTNDQFGQHLGVSGRYIRSIKNGERNISKQIAQKIIEFREKKEQIRNKIDPT